MQASFRGRYGRMSPRGLDSPVGLLCRCQTASDEPLTGIKAENRHLRQMNPWQWLLDSAYLAVLRNTRVGNAHGIELRSVRHRSEKFVEVCSRSIELIRELDERRFGWVKRFNRFIVDQSLPSGAGSGQYRHRIGVTVIDFEYDPSFGDELTHAAYFAGVIVHEATHGKLRNRGIATTKENRVQVERICVSQENSFLRRLDTIRPNLGSDLTRPFDPRRWEFSWNASRFRQTIAHLKRVREIGAAKEALDSNT